MSKAVFRFDPFSIEGIADINGYVGDFEYLKVPSPWVPFVTAWLQNLKYEMLYTGSDAERRRIAANASLLPFLWDEVEMIEDVRLNANGQLEKLVNGVWVDAGTHIAIDDVRLGLNGLLEKFVNGVWVDAGTHEVLIEDVRLNANGQLEKLVNGVWVDAGAITEHITNIRLVGSVFEYELNGNWVIWGSLSQSVGVEDVRISSSGLLEKFISGVWSDAGTHQAIENVRYNAGALEALTGGVWFEFASLREYIISLDVAGRYIQAMRHDGIFANEFQTDWVTQVALDSGGNLLYYRSLEDFDGGRHESIEDIRVQDGVIQKLVTGAWLYTADLSDYALPATTDEDRYCYAAQALRANAIDSFVDLMQTLEFGVGALNFALGFFIKYTDDIVKIVPPLGVITGLSETTVNVVYEVTDNALAFLENTAKDVEVWSLVAELFYTAMLEEAPKGNMRGLPANLLAKTLYSTTELTVDVVNDVVEINYFDTLTTLLNATDEAVANAIVQWFILTRNDGFFALAGNLGDPWTPTVSELTKLAEFFDDRDCTNYGSSSSGQYKKTFSFVGDPQGWIPVTTDSSTAEHIPSTGIWLGQEVQPTFRQSGTKLQIKFDELIRGVISQDIDLVVIEGYWIPNSNNVSHYLRLTVRHGGGPVIYDRQLPNAGFWQLQITINNTPPVDELQIFFEDLNAANGDDVDGQFYIDKVGFIGTAPYTLA